MIDPVDSLALGLLLGASIWLQLRVRRGGGTVSWRDFAVFCAVVSVVGFYIGWRLYEVT